MNRRCNYWKLVLISILSGTLLTAVLTMIAIDCDKRSNCDGRIGAAALWQVNLLNQIIPPGPIMGYGADGQPIYEGSPLYILILFAGILSGIPIYTILVYLILWLNCKFFNRNYEEEK